MKIIKELDSVTNKYEVEFYVGDEVQYDFTWHSKVWRPIYKIIKIELIRYGKEMTRDGWFHIIDCEEIELTTKIYGYPYTDDGEMQYHCASLLDRKKIRIINNQPNP